MNIKAYLQTCLQSDLLSLGQACNWLEKSPLFQADPAFAGKVTAVRAAITDVFAHVDTKLEKRKVSP